MAGEQAKATNLPYSGAFKERTMANMRKNNAAEEERLFGMEAFRDEDYEKALTHFTAALRDGAGLENNRALIR